MTQSEVQYVSSVRDALAALYEGVGSLRQKENRDQSPGSMAELEQSDPKWTEDVVNAASTGTLLLESGGEHLTLFVKSITESVEPIACWTCIRAMLEPCALACWLLDAQIDSKERAGRSIAHRYKGIDEHLTYSRCTGQPANVIQDIEDRLDYLDKKAVKLGFPRLTEKKTHKRNGAGCRVPSATKVIDDYLGMGDAYRLLSAMAHGHGWAISQLGFRKVQMSDFTSVGGVPVRRLEKSLSITGVAYLGLIATKAFGKTAAQHFRYAGFDTSPIDLLEPVSKPFENSERASQLQ